MMGHLMSLKLRQGQIWKRGEEYIRIVRLERLEVGYKTFTSFKPGAEGKHHVTSKKDFCRLLKECKLQEPRPLDTGADALPVE